MTRIEPTTTPRRSRALMLPALTAALLATTVASAYAEKVKAMSFTTQSIYNEEIRVVSTDNKKWNDIKSGTVKFGAHVNIETNGRVDQAGVVLGACNTAACLGKPVLWSVMPKSKDYEKQTTISFSTDKIPISSPGMISTLPVGDEIIAKCNSHLTPGSANEHSFFQLVPVTFVADTSSKYDPDAGAIGPGTADWFTNIEHSTSNSFAVKVVCEPFKIKRDIDDVAAEQPKNLSVSSIELFRTTYSNANSQPNPGTVCKKARWLVRLTTNKKGPVKFKLWTKVGDAPMTSKVIDAWSSFDGNSKFQAEYAEWTEVTKTTHVQAMAEDMTNPIGQSTGWKDITLQCDGVAGGLADNSGRDNDGPVTQPLKVTGELTLADKADAPKDKPRLGQAVFKIWASKPGTTSYKLTCSGGRQWEGKLSTSKVAEHKYQAVGAHNFQIAKTEQIGCVLRSTSMPKNDVVAVASELFKLVKRNPKLDGPNTLSNPPKPQTGGTSARPGANIAPLPKLSCAGGKVIRQACICPAGTVKIHAGSNAYRCMPRTVRPGRLAPNAGQSSAQESMPKISTAPRRAVLVR